ncbi:hypothetical protein [Vampirovibrio sp.]|uniref:hypothetical protein n=1 Tax=Vampirovibrio sp. TaxID=2717857 RepID=UPI003594866B
MSTGFPPTLNSFTALNRPGLYSSANAPVSGMTAIAQSLGGTVLNTSRVPLKLERVAGTPDGASLLENLYETRLTGWPVLDRAIAKSKQVGAYGWQAFSVLLGDTWRGSLVGALGGGSLGLAGGGLVKLVKKSWPLTALLTAGPVLGGILGASGSGTVAFVRSLNGLRGHVQQSLKEQALGLKAALTNVER